MGYLTTEQTLPLLLKITQEFENAARLKPLTPEQAAEQWDTLFTTHLSPLNIKYNITDTPRGLSILGTYLSEQDTLAFRDLRTDQITAARTLYIRAQKAAAEEAAPRTLKKIPMYIKQYIKEIEKIQQEEKKLGESSEYSQAFWKNKIKELEKIGAFLENPTASDEAATYTKKVLKDLGEQQLSEGQDFKGVEVLYKYLSHEIGAHVDENEVATIKGKVEGLKNKVADFFLLSQTGLKAPKTAVRNLEINNIEHDRAWALEEDEIQGAPAAEAERSPDEEFFFSKIATKSKDKSKDKVSSPSEAIETSIRNKLEKILELYTKEVKNLPTKKNKQDVLAQLSSTSFTTEVIKELLTSYNPKTNEADLLNETAISNIHFESLILNPTQEKALKKKVTRKFKELSAPQKHQKIIKQANQHVEKLKSELKKLNVEITNHPNNPQNAKIEELVKRRTEFEWDISYMDGLSEMLANGGHTKPNFLTEMRNEKAIYVEASKQDKKYIDVVNLIEEILKVSDPYYDDIKKLDQYIENLNKDLKRNPPKENEDFSKNSNRQEKLKIAEQVRQRLLTLVELVNKGDKQYYRTVEDKSIIEFMNTARAKNMAHTKTFIGKGKLDGIIGDILNKLNPDPKRKSKP